MNEAVTLGATVVSNSYGGAESGAIPASVLAAYNHSGVVITASTGDNGMFDWDNANDFGSSSNAPAIPSSLKTVVAVGGTALYLNSDATRSAETVWNENGSSDVTGGNLLSAMGATGGGCSTGHRAGLAEGGRELLADDLRKQAPRRGCRGSGRPVHRL